MTIFLIFVAFGLGLLFRGVNSNQRNEADHGHGEGQVHEEAEPTRWTCSMHPQIILPNNDQQCPICFMDLIPLEEKSREGLDPNELALSKSAVAMADILTTKVVRQPAIRRLRLVGKVKQDETRTRTITSRVDGRLDRLYVDSTGQLVTRGMKLADIYSPQLYSAQAELQAAVRLGQSIQEEGLLAGTGDATVRAAVKRLKLWGLDQQQIQDIIDGGQIKEHLVVRAPVGGVVLARVASSGDYVATGTVLYRIADLDQVWVTLDAFEVDIPWLSEGQQVSFTTRAFPGREFSGTILFINQVLSRRTRTVEVRLQVGNSDGLLKPGMLVTARVEVALGADGQLLTPGDEPSDPTNHPLVIPATAPLLTGDRAVVYVHRIEDGQAVFQGRQIMLGPQAGDYYIVAAGLEEGDEVVTRGSFKIDSALQIQAQPSMMSHDPVATEFMAALDRALNGYFELQAALADDDDTAARAHSRTLGNTLHELGAASAALTPSGRVYWSGYNNEIQSAANGVQDAADIEKRRLAFEPLSDNLWAVVDHFGCGSDVEVRRFHCPMAMDGAGAYWLQNHATVDNPYYGSTMRRCGSQVGAVQ